LTTTQTFGCGWPSAPANGKGELLLLLLFNGYCS
jgi:hypothetical protein